MKKSAPSRGRPPFDPDGCSGGVSRAWRLVTGKAPPFEECCNNHDYAYWLGGTERRREAADRRLRMCVTAHGYKKLAWAMWLAVRIFGGPHFIFRRGRHRRGRGDKESK